MPNYTDLTGLAGVASATTVVAFVLLQTLLPVRSRTQQALLLGAIFAVMLIPFGGMPLAAYVRGVSGDLSITTLLLSWCALLRPWLGETDTGKRFVLLLVVALVAVALYPMALGAGSYDPYRLGYGNFQFVSVLMLVAMLAWYLKYPLIALCIALAALTWATGWYESDNYWDYLIDPFVSVYALAAVISRILRSLFKSRRADPG